MFNYNSLSILKIKNIYLASAFKNLLLNIKNVLAYKQFQKI